jgi:hypothetical protein
MPPAFNLSQDQTLQLKNFATPALLPVAGAEQGGANFSLKSKRSYFVLP